MADCSKRDEIVRVALELFAEKGFHGTSMAMVAERAKVGAGTIYRYFESKDDLVIQLFEEAEIKVYQTLSERSVDHHSIRDRFLHLCTSLIRYLIDNPIYFKYLELFFNSPYGIEYRRDKISNKENDSKDKCNMFVEMFDEGLSQGVMKNLPRAILFALCFGPIMDMVRDHILGFIQLDDVLIYQAIEACWDAVKQ